MTTPWIQNISYTDVQVGFHTDPGPNCMMINIVDPAMVFPTPKFDFKEIHRFEFLDIEEDDFALDEAMRCSQEQAAELVRLLLHAKDCNMHVIVSCVAGVCRSGAVCELGVMLGFEDTGRFRSPNLLVKHRMMRALGIYYGDE